MAPEADSSESSPLTDSRLRVVYVIGLALNSIALVVSASAGETFIAITFGFIILYLLLRYWMIVKS